MKPHKTTTIRISLRWVLAALVVLFAAGLLGGIAATTIRAPQRILQSDTSGAPATTVQQVTLSPSRSAAAVVETTNRSVVLLARPGAVFTPIATGIIITNDGVIVTPQVVGPGALNALDDQGRIVRLESIGADELYGLSYFRLPGGVAAPPELTTDGLGAGSSVLILGRSAQTGQPVAKNALVSRHALPPESAPAGVQRTLELEIHSQPEMGPGSPLMADDGALAGILTNPEQGTALFASEIQRSLVRVTQGRREANIWEDLGLSIRYNFEEAKEESGPVFSPVITAVAAGSRAQIAGLRAGDIVRSIQGEAVAWNTSLTQQLEAAAGEIQVQVDRQGETRTALISR